MPVEEAVEFVDHQLEKARVALHRHAGDVGGDKDVFQVENLLVAIGVLRAHIRVEHI